MVVAGSGELGVGSPGTPGRVAQRERTRRKLLVAGLRFLAENKTDVAVLEVARRAGVGQGSFYNHFPDKPTFFHQVTVFGVELAAALMERAVGRVDDPAQRFAMNFRLLAELHRALPSLSRVLIGRVGEIYSLAGGLVQSMRQDILGGIDSGRFELDTVEGAVGTVVGSAMMLGQRIHNEPGLDVGTASTEVATDLLVMLGLPRSGAREVAALPLPRDAFVDMVSQSF